MDLLRFTTAGSVDDGKSTLIGRLLYDSKAIFEDQMEAVERASAKRGNGAVDLSLLTDGLRAEREQGITIDVAYRYFATPKRKFIIADTPGHIQYTRNMVTGASTANLAIILVDARKGLVEQTCRHSFIAALLGIPHIVFCVNKMDLVGYDEEVFNRIQRDLEDFCSKLDVHDVRYIPISALNGDSVVERGNNMAWYQGPTLMYLLENTHISADINHIDRRFPVQYVIRPQNDRWHDFRGYAGRIAGGAFRVGDAVQVLPAGFSTKIKTIHTDAGDLDEAFAPMSVTLTLEDDLDISRGDMIVGVNTLPTSSQGPGGDDLLVQRAAAASQRQVRDPAHHARCPLPDQGGALQDGHQHPPQGGRRPVDRHERHRAHQPAQHGATALRQVHAQPQHRQLHPDR
jgi:sulfate adenylyltransferase subunit 1